MVLAASVAGSQLLSSKACIQPEVVALDQVVLRLGYKSLGMSHAVSAKFQPTVCFQRTLMNEGGLQILREVFDLFLTNVEPIISGKSC